MSDLILSYNTTRFPLSSPLGSRIRRGLTVEKILPLFSGGLHNRMKTRITLPTIRESLSQHALFHEIPFGIVQRDAEGDQ